MFDLNLWDQEQGVPDSHCIPHLEEEHCELVKTLLGQKEQSHLLFLAATARTQLIGMHLEMDQIQHCHNLKVYHLPPL